jgi:hypothetical protein
MSSYHKRRKKSSDDLEELTLAIENDLESQHTVSDIELDEFARSLEKEFEPSPSPISLSRFISPTYQEPSVPFWFKYEDAYKYNKIIDLCFSYIVEKYKNKFDTMVTLSLKVMIENARPTRIAPELGFYKSLRKCIRKNPKFIIIPYGIEYYDRGIIKGHKCLVIVNNFLQTIEYFDPLGSDYRQGYYENKDYEALNKFLNVFDSYHKFPFEKSCPADSFQTLEKDYKKSKEDLEGYCAIWSWFITDLRLSYPESEALHIQERYLEDIEAKYGDETAKFLRYFIVRYGNYVFSKVKPKTPRPNVYEPDIEYLVDYL